MIPGSSFTSAPNAAELQQILKNAIMDVLYPLPSAFIEKDSELAKRKVSGSVLMGDVAMGAIMRRIDQIGRVGIKKTDIYVFGLMQW